jgi:predicted DNA-binding mobile mystery protein A
MQCIRAKRPFPFVQTHNTFMRRRLDQQLGGFDVRTWERPMCGWIKEIREALCMSTIALAERMSISDSRAGRLERAELEDSLRLSTLRRAARALNCRLFYVFVPDEPLEDMVLRQAYAKAVEELSSAARAPRTEEGREERLETRTLELVDATRLWRMPRRTTPRQTG